MTTNPAFRATAESNQNALRQEKLELEAAYLQARDMIDSGRQDALEAQHYREIAVRLSDFNYAKAHPLEPVHIMWELRHEFELVLRPRVIVARYDELTTQIADYSKQLNTEADN
jgi:hypothetical protein